MSATSVCQQLEVFNGSYFNWIAAGTGAFHYWATTTGKEVSDFSEGGLCCFHFPLLGAFLTNSLTQDQIGNLIIDQMSSGLSGKEPLGWVPPGLQKYKPKGSALPRRGDVVFFSGKGAQYFAHVSVATGQGSETISFGHNAPYLQGGKHLLKIEKLTIEQILGLNKAFTAAHFGTPCW